MAEPEAEKVNPNPEAAKPAAKPAVDATKYVGTPAVGTSKAAAAAGRSRNCSVDRNRPAAAAICVDDGHRFPDRLVFGVLSFFPTADSV